MDEVIQEILEYVMSNIHGRMCNESNDNLYLGRAIIEAGDGDHLEIGSLFGGSAIFVALLKNKLGIKGHIYAVDPFTGYYKDTLDDSSQKIGGILDPFSNLPVTVETAMDNAKKFNVEDRITFIKQLSYPLPEQLLDKKFVTSYIDGDHWNLAPILDWLSVKDLTTKFVIFDNNDGRIGIKTACKVASETIGWKEYFSKEVTYIVERTG